MTRPLRIAAGAIIALAACAAIWALLLDAGVKAFPADSFLADTVRVARESRIIFVLAGVAGADAAAVMFVTRWQRPTPASIGLAIALCGAVLSLLAIGADLLSTADLDSETYPQPMFWYHVVGMILNATFGCFIVGWALWLGSVLTAHWRRGPVGLSPLRVCALIVVAAAAAVAGWALLGLPGVMQPADDYFQDTYYLVAAQRQVLPFAGVSVAIAMVVALAAGTPMARRKLAATGLWMILAGAALLLGFVVAEVAQHAVSRPMRLEAAMARASALSQIGAAAGMTALILLVLGIMLWVAARFTGAGRGRGAI